MVAGSIEWFAEKSKAEDKVRLIAHIEELRQKFYLRFSPAKLREMSGKELLLKVFDNTSDTMMHLLMFDQEYRKFGASSEYPYMSILYRGADGIWTYFESNKHIKLKHTEAEERAVFIRDGILKCIELIESCELNTISDYKDLEKEMKVAFKAYNYVTVLKYFQMIFPYYFAGMYSDFTLNRCIQILGLRNPGKSASHRIQKMGLISIMARNCDINNIMFNSVYASEWGWVDEHDTCLSAENNYNILSCRKMNKGLYSLQ